MGATEGVIVPIIMTAHMRAKESSDGAAQRFRLKMVPRTKAVMSQ
jgi:hypothetical protein